MKRLLVSLAAVAIASPAMAAVNVWSTSFDTSEYEVLGPFPWSGLSTSYGGANFESSGTIPQSGTQVFRNATSGTTIFTATGLGAHTGLELGFDITFVDSWDSDNGISVVAPDWLFVNIDGLAPQQWTVASASGSNFIVAPECSLLSGGTNTIGRGWNDHTYRCSFSFAHSNPNWSMSINAGGAGFQYGDDESWAIDNFALAAVPAGVVIPEPATWAMLIAGFGLVGAAARRRRLATA